MPEDWIRLSHICQRCGVVGLPYYVISSLKDAFRLPVENPLESKPDEKWFLRRCLGFHQDPKTEKIITEVIDKNLVVLRPVWHFLTVDEIEVNMKDWPTPKVRLVQEKHPKSIWRWKYWYPAFSFFWAFIFHTENEFLRRPEIIWQAIEKHTNDFVNLERGEKETTEAYTQFYLALYERILGIFSDVEKSLPHYIKNIVESEDLKSEERKERPILFKQAIDFLCEKVEAKLI